jgi:hypothetical protein
MGAVGNHERAGLRFHPPNQRFSPEDRVGPTLGRAIVALPLFKGMPKMDQFLYVVLVVLPVAAIASLCVTVLGEKLGLWDN